MKPTADHPLDVLWQPGTLLSVFAAGELMAITFSLATDLPGDRLSRFGVFSFAVQWVAILTLSLLYAMRHELRRLRIGGVVAFALVALLAVVLASTYAGWRLLGSLGQMSEAEWWQAGLRFYVALVAMVLFGLLALRSEWQSRRLQLRTKQAELDALRARVNPHFLFNTLNTATALVHEQPDQAERVLLDLSDLFRAALSGREETGLEQEILLTRRYLEIEALRLGSRLDVVWSLPTPLPAINVPTLALQALAENAIHHGIEAQPGAGDVTIEMIDGARTVTLRVSNPLPGDLPATPRHQVGLAASRARIEAMTAGQGELRTRQDGGRFIAEIILPR